MTHVRVGGKARSTQTFYGVRACTPALRRHSRWSAAALWPLSLFTAWGVLRDCRIQIRDVIAVALPIRVPPSIDIPPCSKPRWLLPYYSEAEKRQLLESSLMKSPQAAGPWGGTALPLLSHPATPFLSSAV
jgi:hypothetical protein